MLATITFHDFLTENSNKGKDAVYYFAYSGNMFLPQMNKRLKHKYAKVCIGRERNCLYLQ